jgi:hypothetical protein
MKRASIIIMGLLISHSIYSNETTINFRNYYYGVCLDETPIQEFNTYLALYKDSKDATVKGYQSVIWFLWADFYLNPIKKWKCFNIGKEKLDQLIESHADNPELRFLRLTIQDNVPKFLGYNGDIKEDKEFIHNNLSKILDKDLQERIRYYLCYNSMAKIK